MTQARITKLLPTARLSSHGFSSPQFQTPLEVVTAFGAMQAQDYGQALWAIASRIPGCTRQDVEGAIERFEIIRTWSMRGTIHVVPATDAKWMVDLLTPRVTAKLKSRRSQLNITPADIEQCGKTLAHAMQGKTLLTRPGVFQLLNSIGQPTANQRGYHMLVELGHQGLIFIGPNAGKQQTFGLLDEFTRSRILSRDDSLREIAIRFFTSHAPAKLQDFAYWTGLTLTDARYAIECASDNLSHVTVDDTDYIAGIRFEQPIVQANKSTHLMAGFDEYFLPYRDRSAILNPDYANYVVPGNNGMFAPILVINGVVSGVWKRTIAKRSVAVKIYTFPGVIIPPEQLAKSLVAYEQFIGLPVTATIASI